MADSKVVMISNGLRGRENPQQYVEKCRAAVRKYYSSKPNEWRLLDTFFKDFDGNRLQFLGKSISEGLALADEIVFMDDWHNFDGCCVEHMIAVRYGLSIVYLSSEG